MVQKKEMIWAPTKGTNCCLLKPRQWLQRTEAYPSTLKKDDLCALTWGGGACDNTAVFVAVIITIIWGKSWICLLCVAGSKWAQQHTGKPNPTA
eukprot:13851979-Ditylum_brightwellii.AAC.1